MLMTNNSMLRICLSLALISTSYILSMEEREDEGYEAISSTSTNDFSEGLTTALERPNWIILLELGEALGTSNRRNFPLFRPNIARTRNLIGELLSRNDSKEDLLKALRLLIKTAAWYRNEVDSCCNGKNCCDMSRTCASSCLCLLSIIALISKDFGGALQFGGSALAIQAADSTYRYAYPAFNEEEFSHIIHIITDILKALPDKDIQLDEETENSLRLIKNFGKIRAFLSSSSKKDN